MDQEIAGAITTVDERDPLGCRGIGLEPADQVGEDRFRRMFGDCDQLAPFRDLAACETGAGSRYAEEIKTGGAPVERMQGSEGRDETGGERTARGRRGVEHAAFSA